MVFNYKLLQELEETYERAEQEGNDVARAQAVREETSPCCSGAGASSSSVASAGAGAQLRAICASKAMTDARTAISFPAYAASSQAVAMGSRTSTTATPLYTTPRRRGTA